MERIVTNLTASVSRRTLNGRSYLVAPVTLIVPGVLDGSEGPIYYPPEEVALNHSMWDGIPLVSYHPTKEGVPISARNPVVLDAQGLGFVFNSHVRESNSLGGEAWFDEVLTNAFDRKLAPQDRIMPRLLSGRTIEVSTGVFVGVKEPKSGVTDKGVPYMKVARALRADHLAVLPDQVGACSVKDGCGVFVTNRGGDKSITTSDGGTKMPLTQEQRKTHVDFLMANCSCWKSQDSEQILNSLPDDKLVELKADADRNRPGPAPANPSPAPTLSAEQMDQLAELIRAKMTASNPANPAPTNPAPANPAPANPAPTPAPAAPANVPAPVGNNVPVARPLTPQEWMTAAPPQIQALFAEGLQSQEIERSRLADALVANVSDPVTKQRNHTLLMAKPLSELRLMASLLPVQTILPGQGLPGFGHQPPNPIIHLGGGPAPAVGNAYPADGSEQGMLTLPSMDWGKAAGSGSDE